MANKDKKNDTIKIAGKKIDISDYGKKIGAGELKQIEKKTGLTPTSIVSRIETRAPSAKVASSAQNYASTWQPPTNTNTNTNTNNNNNNVNPNPTSATINGIQFDTNTLNTLFQNVGNANVDLQRAENEGDLNVANAYANAQNRVAELGLEGTKYTADRESEWRQRVAEIETKGKLDLQPIINAGLERVADIEGLAARDVAKTTGEYSLKSMTTRTEADKALGKMQLAGSMYGLLTSAFG
jgi:hypothetical protein